MPRLPVDAERADGSCPWPAVNTLVRLTVGSSSDPDAEPVAVDVPSRVEDVMLPEPSSGRNRPARPAELFVAPPRYVGDVNGPRPGTSCLVTWPTPVGMMQLPATFVDRELVGPVVRAWRLAVNGGLYRRQRRRYVRVEWSSPVRLEVPPDDESPADMDGAGVAEVDGAGGADMDGAGVARGEAGTRQVSGTTLDLSEGGLRCLLPPPALVLGQRVRVLLSIDGEDLVLDSDVVRAQPLEARPGVVKQVETGVEFCDPEEYGDVLRRAVFSEQLRLRRAGLRQ